MSGAREAYPEAAARQRLGCRCRAAGVHAADWLHDANGRRIGRIRLACCPFSGCYSGPHDHAAVPAHPGMKAKYFVALFGALELLMVCPAAQALPTLPTWAACWAHG